MGLASKNGLADDLLDYIASQYPDAIVSNFNFLASGFESEIYAFHLQLPDSPAKNYILRLFPGEGAAEKLKREAKALSLLHEADFPVPGLFLQEADPKILGKPFEIIDKLEGQVLWPLLATAEPKEADGLLKRFGGLLARLHKLDWRSFSDDVDRYEQDPTLSLEEMLAQYQTLYTKYNLSGFLQIVDWLNAHKREVSIKPAMVHQDFHANNVFLSSYDQLFVIDWTQFAVSDRRIDLCWTLLIMGDLGNPNWKKQILDAYAAELNQPMEDLNYFNVIVYMKLLASAVISFSFNPKEIGLQSGSVDAIKAQESVYKQLAQQIQNITGIKVPELDNMLDNI